jgi:hypothetical protein
MSRLCVVVLAALSVAAVLQTSGAQTVASNQDGMAPLATPQNEPQRVAAAIIGAGFPSPQHIVQVGAATGGFLELFMAKFPAARGTWIEAITAEHQLPDAHKHLDRFGDRVDFKAGCARRDLSRKTCILPKDTDVIITGSLSIQQDIEGMRRVYKAGADMLPPGGWLVNVDRVTFSDPSFGALMKTAVKGFPPEYVGIPLHYPQFKVPTADEQVQAMRAAGLEAQVVWQSFDEVVIMGRKSPAN